MKSSNSFKRTEAATVRRNLGGTALFALVLLVAVGVAFAEEQTDVKAKQILARVSAHDFHPIRDGFTFDRQ
ncbi:MAG: hypothetical protein L0Z50_03845, partial [Verrucomicrobiales bacterium]|nr:hypothetical protein [Verrucomicrobiales bacterium]